nr:GNAT family N-acetyltransferase [Vagococcus acidifermentans]
MLNDRKTSRTIGMDGVLLEEIMGEAVLEVAYVIKEPFQGQGYATERLQACIGIIFHQICAPRFVVQCAVENVASCKVADMYRIVCMK